MAIRRICVNEVTDFTTQSTITVVCTNPTFTPIGAADEVFCALYNVSASFGTPPTISFSYDVSIEYQYLNQGVTFEDYCQVTGGSGSVTLPDGATVCCGAASVLSSITCNSANITTTPTSVSAAITVTFTLTNLCAQTIICVEDTVCP